MADPIVLSDTILTIAEDVADMYVEGWKESRAFATIAEEQLVSPIDGEERTVWFLIDPHLSTKGKTLAGLRSRFNERLGDGNTVVLNPALISTVGELDFVLLHEICHAVDPIFEQEVAVLNDPRRGRVPLNALKQYHLEHEQRAFPGMWIGRLRDDLVLGRYAGPDEAIARYRAASIEFNGFWVYAPDLQNQTREHFRQIVADLEGR